jgi:hypothetical protein
MTGCLIDTLKDSILIKFSLGFFAIPDKYLEKPCIFHDKDDRVEINRYKLTHVETQKKCAVSDYLEKKEMTGKILPR